MSRPPLDLSALMQRSQAGDQAAYRELLAHARSAATGYLRRRLADASAVDDVCQNVLLKLHVARHTFDPTYPFAPWFFGIVRHALVDHVRQRQRDGARLELTDAADEELGEGAQAEAALVAREALDTLTDEQRETIEMLKVEGLTMEEASARAGTTVAAMKVRAHRAYKALKSALGKSEKKAS